MIAYYRGQYKALLQDIAKASGLPGRSGPVFMAQHSEKVQVDEPSVRQPAPFIAGSERLQVTAKTERENAHYARADVVTSAPIADLTGTYSGPNGHLFRAACARASCARARDMLNKHGTR